MYILYIYTTIPKKYNSCSLKSCKKKETDSFLSVFLHAGSPVLSIEEEVPVEWKKKE